MLNSNFVTLPPTIWAIDSSIADPARRRALVCPPSFEEIVAELCAAVSVKRVASEPMKPWAGPAPLPQRVTVVLEVREGNVVDLFHNSAAGVRAQCLHAVELGAIALDYARDRLREKALQLTQSRRHGAVLKHIIAQSLAQASTKVWIHQGYWVRHARMADRHLRITQWEEHEATANAKEKRLLRYGSKAPQAPGLVDLIGGWGHPSGANLGKSIALRPLQVHKFGFT